LRLVAAENLLELPQQRRSFLELGCVLRTPRTPTTTRRKSKPRKALASAQVHVSTLLSGASVLSASRLEPLVLFPLASPVRLPGRRGCYHPRPPQIRTRQFPASGSSRESFVPSGVAVDDPGQWQRMAGEERVEYGPCEQLPSRSTFHPLVPDPLDLVAIFL